VKKQPGVQPLQLPAIRTFWARLIDARRHGFHFPLLAALVILGSAWLFLGVLEDVATGDPLVDVDVAVHGVLQQLRTPSMDSAMVAATELGDVQVLLPVILASLAWFVWRRLWRTCLYWLAAVGVAEVFVKLLKVALHRARPSLLYDGVESFAFPSSHATLSVVAYGFLAFLICRKQRAPVRLLIATTTALGIALIALSRLYLGVHWASDVIAGASFGLAWIGALAMVYSYRTDDDVKPNQLAIVVVAALLVSGTWHIMQSHASDALRYAPPSAVGESGSDCARPAVLAGGTLRSSHAVSSTPNRSPMCSTVISAAAYRLVLTGSRA
jgi:cation-transporting ATPase E/undecaprenyl-diphosphatase